MDYVKMNLIQPQQHNPSAEQGRVFFNLSKGGVNEVPSQKVPLEYEDIFNFSLIGVAPGDECWWKVCLEVARPHS